MVISFINQVDVLKTDNADGLKRLKGAKQMSKYEKLFLKRIYVQLFNDPEPTPGATPEPVKDPEPAKEPKMVNMSQDDYDASIAKRLDRAEKAWEKKFHESDSFKAFKAYEEGQKSETDKLNEKLKGMSELEKSNADMAKKIQGYEQSSLLTKADVNPEFNEFVMHKIQSSMNEGDDFGESLEKFKTDEANAKYFGSQQQSSTRQGQRHGKGGGQDSKASTIIDKIYGNKK